LIDDQGSRIQGAQGSSERLNNHNNLNVAQLEVISRLCVVHPVNEYELLGNIPAHEENGDEVFSE